MKDNKLIAEFMGVYSKENGYDYTKIGNKGVSYHKSWDWLMPVVAKCTELNNDEFDNQSIAWALLSNSIIDVYDQVVEFIKNQNN